MNLFAGAKYITPRESLQKLSLFFFLRTFAPFFSPKAEKMEATFTQTLLPRAGGFITSRGKKKTTKKSRRRGYLSRGVCARASSSSSSSDDDDDKNKAPLNSLNSAIELRSKLQEVALAARTRCVESVRVYTRTERFLFFFLSLSLSLSLSVADDSVHSLCV